jgi:hypothetical protein
MRANRFVIFRSALVLVLSAAVAGPMPAKAGFQLVLSPNALGANDAVNWSGFDVNNPTIVSMNGINVSVQGGGTNTTLSLSTLSGSPAIADLGGENYGTFGPYSSASIILTFSQPVAAAGGLMEALEEGSITAGLPFQITAFDSNGNSQAFDYTSGVSGYGFFGIVSDTGNLSKLIINAYTYNADTLLEVGSLDLQDSPPVSSVAAPSSFALASLGVLVLLGCRCWRRCWLAMV